MNKLQIHRQSMEASSDVSYCERETYDDDWGSRSTLSQLEEVATQSSSHCDASALRAERDALARALAAERSRAAAAARAHDARLAELHGVIAELVRRRAADRHAAPIPEEELSDECESTTQPAGELDPDADRSRTDQNDTSSALSPELGKDPHELPDDTDTSQDIPHRVSDQPAVRVTTPTHNSVCDTSLHLSERDSELCLSTARCCQAARQGHGSGGSCEREHGSHDGGRQDTARRCESRQAKLASRVRLRKTDETDSNPLPNTEERWCAETAQQLALEVCAQAELREALVAATNDGEAFQASLSAWRARCARLEADTRVLECALAAATDTAHRVSCACAVQESSTVALCGALRAADRALEVYDVLLALAETQPGRGAGAGEGAEREAAERVGHQILAALEAEPVPALGEPLLSPGPWLQPPAQAVCVSGWSPAQEARLRAHAARLKAETVSLRNLAPPPHFISHHEIEEDDLTRCLGNSTLAEMEAAVDMQEVLSARERYLSSAAGGLAAPPPAPSPPPADGKTPKSSRRRRERHWLDAASETDL